MELLRGKIEPAKRGVGWGWEPIPSYPLKSCTKRNSRAGALEREPQDEVKWRGIPATRNVANFWRWGPIKGRGHGQKRGLEIAETLKGMILLLALGSGVQVLGSARKKRTRNPASSELWLRR